MSEYETIDQQSLPEQLTLLTSALYEAVFDPQRWPAFLELFVRANRGRQAVLVLGDHRWNRFGFSCQYGLSQEVMKRYVEHYAAIDPWSRHVRENRTVEGEIL